MGIWLGPMGAGNQEGKAPVFTIYKNGEIAEQGTDYLYNTDSVGNIVNWELALLTNCTINFSKVGKVDLFLVGAGENGGAGFYGYDNNVLTARGGAGGSGGKVYRNENGTDLARHSNITVTIGASEGADSSFGSFSSSSGSYVSTTGSGAYRTQYGNADANANIKSQPTLIDGVYPWDGGESASITVSQKKFGASGGGGGCYLNGTANSSGDGGETGGGKGGSESDGGTTSHKNGYDASSNMGAGGGGGGGSSKDGGNGTGGSGGSGIILIRNHRA